MKRYYTLMWSLLLLAFICLPSTSRAQFIPVAELGKEKLSSRPTPAQVAKESTAALKAKGYVMIGEIFLKDEVKSCWGKNCTASFTCPSEQVKKDLTRELLKKAASKGGDLVILSKDNIVAKGSVSKRGKCTSKGVEYANVPFGVYSGGVWSTRTKNVRVKVCKSWETINGYRCDLDSTGTVWRLDPDLGKRIAAKISAQAAKIAAKAAITSIGYKVAANIINAEAFVSDNRLDPSAPTLAYENSKYGYRDRNGNMAIPAQFTLARPFAEGLARVEIGTEHGYIDKKGAFVIKGGFPIGAVFSEGLAAVGEMPRSFEFKYGYIDMKGESVIPIQFDVANRFSEGLAAAAVGKQFESERWGYINKTGKWVIRQGYYDAKEFSEGLAPVASGNIVKNKWGYINKDGAVIIKPAFDDALGFSEGLAPIAVGAEKKWGYINKDGQIVIQPSFNEADSFSEGLAKVKVAGKYGYIDKSGTFVIKPQFEKASSFSNNEARVILDGAQAFIDKSGKVAIQSK